MRLLRSSTFRLALIYMVLFGASVLILLGFIYWSTAASVGRQTDAIIEAEITGLAERYRLTGLTGLTDVIAERLSRQPAGSSIYLLADPNLRPLVGNLNGWPAAPKTPDGWVMFRLEDYSSGSGEVHRARARTFELRGGFYLLVGRDMHEVDAVRRQVIRALGWGALITVIMALAGGVMMTRSTVRRIETITDTSHEIMTGDLSRRIPTTGTGDDFDKLADNLNSMLAQIEAHMEDVRRVSDNIAHDLKTPLAHLRHRLEQLQRQAVDSEQLREDIDRAILEADKLLSTFSALLRIARIESDAYRAGFKEVDLGALLRDVAELYEPLAEDKGQRLVVSVVHDAHVTADRDLLFQAIANLVDNAIKYAPNGGTIDIALDQESQRPCISIADDGPGIPAAAREKVFQRFFRMEPSRTTPGSGLGLSLVAAVAKLHRARVQLRDNEPGLRVDLRFDLVNGPDLSSVSAELQEMRMSKRE
ncbi:MAG: sensor histidine kinase [Acidiferrobacterales bacterium]